MPVYFLIASVKSFYYYSFYNSVGDCKTGVLNAGHSTTRFFFSIIVSVTKNYRKESKSGFSRFSTKEARKREL